LSRYRWSSYPLYLKGRRERPVWLEVQRVLAEVGLRPGEVDGYEAYVEGRVLELGMKAVKGSGRESCTLGKSGNKGVGP